MKTTLSILLISFLTFGINGPSRALSLSNQQKAKIEKQVDSIFRGSVKAAESLDYEKISLGVEDKYNAGFIVNDSYYAKYDSLITILKANLRSGTKQSIVIQNKKITVLSESIVLLTASGNSNVELANGQTFNLKFMWSFVYEKIDNEWKVIQSHQSKAN